MSRQYVIARKKAEEFTRLLSWGGLHIDTDQSIRRAAVAEMLAVGEFVCPGIRLFRNGQAVGYAEADDISAVLARAGLLRIKTATVKQEVPTSRLRLDSLPRDLSAGNRTAPTMNVKVSLLATKPPRNGSAKT